MSSMWPNPDDIRFAFSNLACCIPRDEEQGGKLEEPPVESILACAPRLEEFVQLAKPKLICCVGTLAEKWIIGKSPDARQQLLAAMPGKKKTKGHGLLLESYKGNLTAIVHPAYILRANVSQQGLLIQKCIVTLANAIDEIVGV